MISDVKWGKSDVCSWGEAAEHQIQGIFLLCVWESSCWVIKRRCKEEGEGSPLHLFLDRNVLFHAHVRAVLINHLAKKRKWSNNCFFVAIWDALRLAFMFILQMWCGHMCPPPNAVCVIWSFKCICSLFQICT